MAFLSRRLHLDMSPRGTDGGAGSGTGVDSDRTTPDRNAGSARKVTPRRTRSAGSPKGTDGSGGLGLSTTPSEEVLYEAPSMGMPHHPQKGPPWLCRRPH